MLVKASQQYEASTWRFTDFVTTEDTVDVEDAVDDGLDGVLLKDSQQYEARFADFIMTKVFDSV